MNLVLDIATSAEFWRRVYPANRMPSSAMPRIPLECAHSQADVWELAPQWLIPEFLTPYEGKLHTLVFDRKLRRATTTHVVHTWSGTIPEGSFYQLSPNVFVMSPCFMFLAASTMLTEAELIAFGDELCGLYGFSPDEDRGFRKRTVPIVSKQQLEAFLHSAVGCSGRKQAIAALPHLVEKSASPMETLDEMTMCLPSRLGGYGIPQPVMNHPVPLSARAARIAKRATCYADMCYPSVPLDIEHHGRHDHSTPEDVASDRARVNGLKEMGFEVIELTAGQVGDLQAYEYIVERISRLVGKRLRKETLGAKPARLRLRHELYTWNQLGGRLRK